MNLIWIHITPHFYVSIWLIIHPFNSVLEDIV
jgi:hypothetical protein